MQGLDQEREDKYTIPSGFVFLDALPLLPNGKLNRLAPPDPGNCRPSGSGWHPRQLLRPRRSFAGSHTGCVGGHQEIPPGATVTIVIQSLSVAQMATVIIQFQGKKMLGEEELARILTELESMSDEEAKQLVAIKVRTRK